MLGADTRFGAQDRRIRLPDTVAKPGSNFLYSAIASSFRLPVDEMKRAYAGTKQHIPHLWRIELDGVKLRQWHPKEIKINAFPTQLVHASERAF